MKVLERNVVRLAVVQHLRSVYGIKIKNWNKNRNKHASLNTMKVFGMALEALPLCHVLDYGDVPCFIADACTSLMEHLDTEGLFRKSGSVLRVKSLRAKLDQGEDCLPTALPLDIAGLLKLFFRELPEPVLTVDLHSAFLKAQDLPEEEQRRSATVLLSCVLPDRNLNTLRYFCSFLKTVSQRCAENKMDSSNLSVIFAPNLFHSGDGGEKLSSGTEKRLKHQAAAVQQLIDNAQHLGVVPPFLMEKVPAMLGCDAAVFSPSSVSLEEKNTLSDLKKSNRRSLGDMVNGALNRFKTSRTPTNTPQSDGAGFSTATPVIMTPNSKRKLDSTQTHGFSSKKRRSLKMNLGLELFPSALFGGASTPGSAHSVAGALDASHSASLSSVGRNARLSSTSARRKSRRLRHRSVSRVESGKAGCFSPRAVKKEPVRKSLRLRFSLGKSSRESNLITHSQLGPKGSEVIGWRLATQESCTGFHFTKEFSPAVVSPSEGSGCVSKSEDDLLTPRWDSAEKSRSWIGDAPDVGSTLPEHPASESGVSKPPEIPSEASGESDLHSLMKPQDDLQTSQRSSVWDHNHTLGHMEMVHLSPLHIDSALFDSPAPFGETSLDGSLWPQHDSRSFLKEASQLIDALDMQSPVAFRPDSSSRVQSTPYAARTQTDAKESPVDKSDDPRDRPADARRMKVAEQIKLFNMMTLASPKATAVRSPLKFQRTPVRQSVRRINSLAGQRKDVRMGWCGAGPVKALSLESALHSLQPKPPVPPKTPAALGDVTNTAPKTKLSSANPHPKSVPRQVSENASGRYRGSPRNPLAEGKLLSAAKPIDL